MPSIFTLSGSKSKKKRSLGSTQHSADADELKLTMDNEGSIYERLNRLKAATISVACLVGRYDVDKAARVFDSVVDEEAKRYKKEWGTTFSKTTKQMVARHYALETRDQTNGCLKNPKSCDLPNVAKAALDKCALPAGTLLGRAARRKKRR